MTMRQWGAWTVVMVLLLAVGGALLDVNNWSQWGNAWFGVINGFAARALVKDNVAPLSRKERRRRHDAECAAALAPHEQRLRDRGIL